MPSIDELLGPQMAGSAAPPPQAAQQAAPAAQPAQAAATPMPAGLSNIDRLLDNGHATDQNTGEKIPLAFSGNTPTTAKNESPLSATDRMKLSLGNPAGNVAYLKQQFKDVQFLPDDKGKPTKEMAVLKDNTWYRVNPDNSKMDFMADPWAKTKEYMTDAATYAPEAIGLGAAIATDYASGGTTIPETAAIAGGVSGAVRTSLGRIVGTYQATPAEQAWDIGFESLLNATGAKIAMGIKPTAGYVANKILPKLAEAYADIMPSAAQGALSKTGKVLGDVGEALANAPKAMLKKMFSSFSVGEANFDTMMENTDRVRSVMNNTFSKTKDPAAYHDEILRDQLGSISDIANNTRGTLTQIYGSMKNKILSQTPKDFSVNLDDAVYGAYSKAIQNGLGEIVVGGKSMGGQQAMDYIAEKGLHNAGFRMYAPEELAAQIQRGGNIGGGIGYLAQDKEAYGIMKQYYDRLGTFVGGQNRTGVAGASALLDFKKVATDLSYSMANTETARATPEVRMLINEGKSAMDDAVFQQFKKAGLDQHFLDLNGTYSKLSDSFAPILQAKNQYDKSGNIRVYEGLLNTFLSRPGKNAASRFAIDDAINHAVTNNLGKLAMDLTDQKLAIQVGEAAKAFNPIKPGYLKADALGSGGAAMMMWAAMNHNYTMMMAAAGTQVLRSPTTTRAAIATSQTMYSGQQWLANMGKQELNNLMTSPAAMNKFMTTVTAGAALHEQVKGKLDSVLQSAQSQGQPQQ